MTTTIRDAQSGDEGAIVRLVRELAGDLAERSQVTEDYVFHYLASPGSHVLLAEIDGRVAGLLSYSLRPNLYHAAATALVEELVVHAPDRGRGVGGALMSELLSRLSRSGCAEVAVSTMTDNEGAQRFYRLHGLVDEAVLLEKHF